jgi:rhamnosyltransferase subunit B
MDIAMHEIAYAHALEADCMLPPARCRFVFQAIGSRGDLAPLMSLASALQARGHECQLLANAKFEDEARALGLGFHGISNFTVNYRGSEAFKLENHMFAGLEGVLEFFRSNDVHPNRTLVVNLDWAAASSLLAERHALPTVRVHLCPFKIRSLLSPPWPLRANLQGLMGRTFHKYKLPAIYAAFDSDARVLGRVNGARAAVGLPPVASASPAEPHVIRQLALFPRWYADPPADWPEMTFAGFPLSRPACALPPRLLEFIAEKGRPLVFTPGTGVDDVQAFFSHARSCCLELGRPGVFLSPYLRCSKAGLGSNIQHFEHVELGALLPHAALLVHHGGIGTTARALESGVPQIVVPVCFDQPDNAGRVAALGVGKWLEREQLSGHALAAAARALWACPDVLRRLAALRRDLTTDRAIETASALLESDAQAALAGYPAMGRPCAAVRLAATGTAA